MIKNTLFFCLKIFFTFTNIVDPDEMQHYAAFYLGLQCLQSYCLGVSRIQMVNKENEMQHNTERTALFWKKSFLIGLIALIRKPVIKHLG